MTADQIKGLRKYRGWTQQQLATAIGVAVSSVARWESPAGRPPKGVALRALQRLAGEALPSGAGPGRGQPEGAGTRAGAVDLGQTVAGIVGGMSCPKGFECAHSGFENLCRARDIGLERHLECLEGDSTDCVFAITFGGSHLCECPLRNYLFRKLAR
ncbi:MAG: helix-turn-helix transcriptional regulator [Gemmatimonadota bacterium]